MKIDNICGNGKEYSSLTELTDVTFENNRLVLRVDNPIAARKFGLSDTTWRYEFDGYSMFWYKDKDENKPKSWSCSCGKGSYTLVSDDVDRQIKAVKEEMVRQIMAKGMLEYFGNKKAFTDVAIELHAFCYHNDGTLYRDTRRMKNVF